MDSDDELLDNVLMCDYCANRTTCANDDIAPVICSMFEEDVPMKRAICEALKKKARRSREGARKAK